MRLDPGVVSETCDDGIAVRVIGYVSKSEHSIAANAAGRYVGFKYDVRVKVTRGSRADGPPHFGIEFGGEPV